MKVWMVLLTCVLLVAETLRATPIVNEQAWIQASDPVAGSWLLEFMDGTRYEIQRPWSWGNGVPTSGLIANVFSDRPKVTIVPSNPTTGDVIQIEVECWVPSSSYGVDQADLDIQGNRITLELHWTGSGIGAQAYAWQTYTTSLGPLQRGSYTLDVRNSGAATGAATKFIRVAPALSPYVFALPSPAVLIEDLQD